MARTRRTSADPGEGGQPPASRREVQAARRRAARHRHRWLRRTVVTTLVLALVATVVGVAGYAYFDYRFDQIKKVHATHLVKEAAPQAPFNVLLVGSDSRAFVGDNSQLQQDFGNPDEQGGQRSDVTMVARFIPATHQVYILSIPRDLWVDIPGNGTFSGMNRINAAFNNGPDLLIQTIERDLHIPINHYASVNFQGFQGMVNAIGGIYMNFPDEVRDQYSGLDVTTTGCQLVNGATALELVRARHLYYLSDGEWEYDGLSDFSRIQRQDAFFRALLAKIGTQLDNPLALNGFIGAAVQNITIDDTISRGDLLHWAEEFRGLNSSQLHTMTLPTVSYVTSGGADVLLEAQPYADNMIFDFNLLGTTTPAKKRTPPTTTTTTTEPRIAPGAISVQVLNGSGVNDVAHTAAAGLQQLGFDVSGTGDASSFDNATTQIEYASGGKDAAEVLAAHVGGASQLVADASLTGDQLTLVLGQSFTGVVGTGAAGSTTTTTSPASSSSTTTTTIPSDVYTNTQPEPWNPTVCTP